MWSLGGSDSTSLRSDSSVKSMSPQYSLRKIYACYYNMQLLSTSRLFRTSYT